jgi:hypothetical protein
VLARRFGFGELQAALRGIATLSGDPGSGDAPIGTHVG